MNFGNQYCQRIDHFKNPLIGVCTYRNCQNQQLCCQLCLVIHKDHAESLIQFDWVRSQMALGIQIIKEIQFNIQECHQVINILSSFIKPAEDCIFNNLQEFQIYNLDLQIGQFRRLGLVSDTLLPQLSELIKLLRLMGKEWENLQKRHSFNVEDDIGVQKKIEQTKLIQKQIYDQQGSFSTLINKNNQFLVRFEGNLQCRYVDIQQNGRIVQGQGLFFGNQMIPKIGMTKFALKILDVKSFVNIGIGNKDVIIRTNYTPNLKFIGHGTYLISNQGYNYSHQSKNQNDVQQSFTFAKYDIILIEIDMNIKSILWTKKSTLQEFQLQINNEQDFYPLIIIHGKVEVLDHF
ncbi:unnamed protein product [Paramecium octaurelia]|uniref:Uncharacterized protein n=1 Tax=Paramecium octaurelia TaxID=43137 RepID=A0A8S1TG49_PAROT|nr:unnamed protein product [Paramecium octaurelia]